MFDGPLSLLAFAPEVLIAIGLILVAVLAVQWRDRLGAGASTLAAWGLSVIAVNSLAGALWNVFAIRWAVNSFGYERLSWVFGISGLITRTVWVIGMALVIAAIFVPRPAAQPTSAGPS